MAAGIPVSATELNFTAGDLSRTMQNVCNRVDEFKKFLDPYTAEALATMFGITVDDATLIKSAYTELAIVTQAQHDNRTFSSRIAGMGDVA